MKSTPLLLPLLLVVLLLPGCGLRDYEELMREAEAHEHHFDEQSKLLDEPLNAPTMKDKETGGNIPVAQFFLRPPKGIERTCEEAPREGLLYRYPVRQASTAGPFLMMELAFGHDQKEFYKQKVEPHFRADRNTSDTSMVRVIDPDRGAPLDFARYEFSEGNVLYSINVCQSGQLQIAIVYHISKGSVTNARQAMNLSLQSLGLGPGAASRQQQAYQRRSPWRLKP